jgi:carboxypeptidase Taq
MTEKSQLKSVSEPTEGYNDLKYYFSNLNTLFSIRNTLAVDMMTTMPAGGLQRRLNDISAMTKRIYAETTTPAVSNLLDKVENSAAANPNGWNAWDLANLKEMRRIHSHLSALPPDLYIASVQVANEGRKRHAAALENGNWADAAYVQQVVDLSRKAADLKQKKFGVDNPYRVLLLGYASDIGNLDIDALYNNLLPPLKALKDKALEKQKSQPAPIALDGDFARGDQMWLNKTVLEMMGFDFKRGSLMVSGLSPMAAGSPDDTRILVRCGKGDTFLDSLEDTLYQGARGIYTQNLPDDWKSQPVGQDMGTLMLNTLSLLYETIIGRTPQFFDFIAVRAEGVFRQFRNKSFDPENLYRLKKVIRPSSIRNSADELTKIFHDVLRYRIEKDLINGSLSAKDLPDRWAAESKDLLGAEPRTKGEGPLQNPDWFTGRFGFIPTNTISHMMAAQIHEKLFAHDAHMVNHIREGNFDVMGEWVKENIHAKGRTEGPLSLFGNITGGMLSEKPLLTHLERRYLSDKR